MSEFKLYEIQPEIDQLLREAIDEDGQIINEDKLHQINYLEIAKEEKCLNVAYAFKNTQANIEAIKTEMARLKRKQDIQTNIAESIKNYLAMNLDEGESYQDVKASIKWRKSSRVHVNDNMIHLLPEKYQRTKIEANLTDIGKALKDGLEIVGCEIVEKMGFNIK